MIASIRDIDVEKMASAIEADAGQALAGLRESIQQAKDGLYGKVYTSQALEKLKRKRQSAYEARKVKSGSRRLPGVLLSPEAAQALDVLMQRGAASKAAAINGALIAAAQGG